MFLHLPDTTFGIHPHVPFSCSENTSSEPPPEIVLPPNLVEANSDTSTGSLWNGSKEQEYRFQDIKCSPYERGFPESGARLIQIASAYGYCHFPIL